MPIYKLTIEYDGTHYFGWQRQLEQRSVQGELIQAVKKFTGVDVDVVGAGRTDSGVHATAQVAHVNLPREYDDFKVMQGINYYLFNKVNDAGESENNVANRIAVLKAERVADDFSARFSAKKRHYLYRIINRRARLGVEAGRAWHVIDQLDDKLMHKAAQTALVGHYDFNSFRDTNCQSKSSIKTLEQLDVRRVGEEVRLFVSGRSFLHHQVRIMAGSLALVGKGRWTIDDLVKAREACDRSSGGPTAPPDGLYLVGVDY